MTKLYCADELKDIAQKHLSEEAKELLEYVAKVTLEQAKKGKYDVAFGTYNMEEIEHILKRKGYKVVCNTITNTHIVSWD